MCVEVVDGLLGLRHLHVLKPRLVAVVKRHALGPQVLHRQRQRHREGQGAVKQAMEANDGLVAERPMLRTSSRTAARSSAFLRSLAALAAPRRLS